MPPTPPIPPRLTTQRKLLYAFVATAGALGLVEAAARALEIWRPPRPVDVGAGFLSDSRLFVPVPDREGMVATAATKLQCFRAQEFSLRKPAGTLRIVMLGGSSMYRLDAELRVLERNLLAVFQGRWRRVEIINCGGLSYGSHRLVRISGEMLAAEPDVVVFYEANNEFEEAQQLHLASLETAGVQRAMSRSAAVRLLRDALVAREAERIREERRSDAALAAAPPRVEGDAYVPCTPQQAEARMKAFRDNVAWILAECRRHRVPLVLGTVPSNLVRPALSRTDRPAWDPVTDLVGQSRYAEANVLARRVLASISGRRQASDVENGILRTLAAEEGVPLVDAEGAVGAAEPHGVPGETLFTDHCHLTDEGNVVLRQAIERVLVDVVRGLPPTPRDR